MTTAQSIPGTQALTAADGREIACAHCGLTCPDESIAIGGDIFCCNGCRTVFAMLHEHGLDRFYEIDENAGIRIGDDHREDAYDYLNDPGIRTRLLDFSDGTTARVRFILPAIHCAACVWLLENLYRLVPGVGSVQVNFPRREATIQFNEQAVTLGTIAARLAELGYEPELNLEHLNRKVMSGAARRLALQIGVAGFCFANIMLMSFPSYFGLDSASESGFRGFFGIISILLSLPALIYSGADYWKAAWLGIRKRVITIDIPIAIGLAALFSHSLFDIAAGGEGFLDSLTGLIFFLLLGRAFQRRSYETLSFERDYTAYFPLAATRVDGTAEAVVPVTSLEPGNRIRIRNQELIPADSRVVDGPALIDYSFVTGESAPVSRDVGDLVHAGGRQVGGSVTLDVLKPVSQSYLTSLWNDPAFDKSIDRSLQSLTDRFSRVFTIGVILIAAGAALWWLPRDAATAVRAFSSVLIVACPCALALSAPFTLGTVVRLLGRKKIYLKNTSVVEQMASVDTILFDKTGTLTHADSDVSFDGAPLRRQEQVLAVSLARQSTHPLSVKIARAYETAGHPEPVTSPAEEPGLGLRGDTGGHTVLLGSAAWLEQNGVAVPEEIAAGPATLLAVDGAYRGAFRFRHAYRGAIRHVTARLARRYRLEVLSGDNPQERETLTGIFGRDARLAFNQSPHDKLETIRERQHEGRRVMMIGDGLNDAGALKQGDVGVAVTERVTAFSPASDAIMDASAFPYLSNILDLARAARWIIAAGIGLSLLYNAVGLTFAARGALSPLVCAILMPVSSVSVVALAVGASWLAAKRKGLLA